MHPQRTLIEAAVLVQEIALATPEDRPQGYDTKYHSNAAMMEMLKLEGPKSGKPDDLMAHYEQRDAILKKHDPLDHHAEQAANALANHYKNYSSKGEPVPSYEIEDVSAFHYSNYSDSISQDHSDRYPNFVNNHPASVKEHMNQFENAIDEKLKTHRLRRIDGRIEPL